MWVQAQVFQSDLGRIKVGDVATLTVDSFPGRVLSGRVNFIYPQVDMDTRTAKARIVFSNPGLLLKPGMYVSVTFKLPMGHQLVIPVSGVLQSGTRQIVFVNRGDGYLEPREVQLGARVGDDFIVVKGLKAGEQIITSANFLIDSESQLQAALGTFVPPPPGAGAASTMSAPQANVALTSEPDPPHKGSNIFRVKLADASGAPISGAEISVTFFMPAMPAMGMAAMRMPVALSEKGNGIYEGSIVFLFHGARTCCSTCCPPWFSFFRSSRLASCLWKRKASSWCAWNFAPIQHACTNLHLPVAAFLFAQICAPGSVPSLAFPFHCNFQCEFSTGTTPGRNMVSTRSLSARRNTLNTTLSPAFSLPRFLR